jgi:tetratricopeptide (TPR) repeat protein
LRKIKALAAGFCFSLEKGAAMERATFRTCLAAILCSLLASAAQARPMPVSLPPGESGRPAPQLQNGIAAPDDFALLDCLGGLVVGDTSRAVKSCSDALAHNPREHDAYKLRGYAYLTEHRFERAGADFQAALRLRPRDDQDRAGLAQSFSGQGLFDRAVAEYRVAVTLAPNKSPYWSALCWARAGTGRQLNTALAECNRALSLQPGAAAALNSRGLVNLRLKKLDAAISDYNAALAAGPLQASARFGRGLARLSAHMTALGARDIVEARRRDPDMDRLFVVLGVLSAKCGYEHTACPSGFPLPLVKPGPPSHLVAKAD